MCCILIFQAENWKGGMPIRVCRSYKFKKASKFAPNEGIRYDGIYKVVKYYPEKGKSGFKVWKFVLRRDDPSLAPWEKKAPKFPIIEKDGQAENSNVENIFHPPKKLIDLIKADQRNEKKWSELLDFKLQKFEWFEKVGESFQCFVCTRRVQEPLTLKCSHNFCRECMKKSLTEGFKECCACREPFGDDFKISAWLNQCGKLLSSPRTATYY